MRFLLTRKVNSLYEYKMVPARTASAAVAEFSTEEGAEAYPHSGFQGKAAWQRVTKDIFETIMQRHPLAVRRNGRVIDDVAAGYVVHGAVGGSA